MYEEILERLSTLKVKENIKILYACESGSRAWGFPSKNSDYDVRFIYVRDRDWYLRVDHESQSDVVEQPINDLLDINGWDFKKALKLLRKSNPALIEWFNSPIVYKKNSKFVSAFKKMIPRYYSPRACFYHYSHMANGNNREYLQGKTVRIKKYFYVLRPILAMKWIEQKKGIVPMEFEVLVDELIVDKNLLSDIKKLLYDKMEGFEEDFMPRIDHISNFINAELERLTDKAQEFEKSNESIDDLNAFFLSVLNGTYG